MVRVFLKVVRVYFKSGPSLSGPNLPIPVLTEDRIEADISYEKQMVIKFICFIYYLSIILKIVDTEELDALVPEIEPSQRCNVRLLYL